MGLVISVPFCASKRSVVSSGRYAPVYGLATGFVLWGALFLPITFGIMLPLINSVDSQTVIQQRDPTGNISTIATGELLAIMDKVIVGSLAFNIFYGLLVVMLTSSLSKAYLHRNQVIL